jgi:predicted small secreted protein
MKHIALAIFGLALVSSTFLTACSSGSSSGGDKATPTETPTTPAGTPTTPAK